MPTVSINSGMAARSHKEGGGGNAPRNREPRLVISTSPRITRTHRCVVFRARAKATGYLRAPWKERIFFCHSTCVHARSRFRVACFPTRCELPSHRARFSVRFANDGDELI